MDRPLSILALVTDAYGGRGGIAEFNRRALDAISTHPAVDRIDVVPRVAADPVGETPRGIWVRQSALQGPVPYLRSALGTSTDGVLCGHLHLLPLAALVASVRRVPLALVLHGIEAWEPPHGGPRGLALRAALKRVDRVVAVSATTLERFGAWASVGEGATGVLPNTFDPAPFAPGPKPDHLLDRYGLRGRPTIITLGRLAGLDRRKGFDVVLEVLPALRARVPDVAYLIAGDGPDRSRLQEKAKALGVADAVVFTGYIDEAEKPDHYRLADCFAMPSRGEGFGIVLLEAMASGVPVVASQADGSNEAVRDGLLGSAVDPGDPDAVVEAVIAALRRPKGVPDGLDYFSYECFAERWRAVVDRTFLP